MGESKPSTAPSVRVRHGLGNPRRPVTVIHAVGEHGYGSRSMLLAALDELDGHTIVDLSACTFIDTTVIGAIIGKALELGKAGYRLEVVVPPAAPFARTFQHLGVASLVSVLDEAPPLGPMA